VKLQGAENMGIRGGEWGRTIRTKGNQQSTTKEERRPLIDGKPKTMPKNSQNIQTVRFGKGLGRRRGEKATPSQPEGQKRKSLKRNTVTMDGARNRSSKNGWGR